MELFTLDDKADGAHFKLTPQCLVGRAFAFRAEPRGEILSKAFTLLPDGLIGGYDHVNERRWAVVDGQLHILSESGVLTCAYAFVDGRLRGDYRDPDQPGALTGVVHYLDDAAPSGQAAIQTFDLFDTLVARRCIYPTDVFRNVERKAGAPGFAQLRHRVEMQMFGARPYGLDDVYDALGSETAWPAEALERLKMLELNEEWENYFPIRAMVARVKPEDMIISDVYLPYEFVRKICSEKCGLENELYLSNYGKHHATVWNELAPRYRITRHHGDNFHADVKSPESFGLQAEHILVSSLSPAEKILMDVGLRPQAEAIREARLRHHDADPAIAGLQQAQLLLNLPLLVLGSYYLIDFARQRDADCLLLCARDCNLWAPLLRLLTFGAPTRPRIHYVAASRATFYSGSADYAAYFHSFLGERSLLVDLVGTGRSPSHFLHLSGLAERVDSFILVGAPEAETQNAFTAETMLQRAFDPFRLALETLNLSLEGSATGARFSDFEFVVARAPHEFDQEGQGLIAAQRRAFLDALPLLAAQSDRFVAPAPDRLRDAAAEVLALAPSYAPSIAALAERLLESLKN